MIERPAITINELCKVYGVSRQFLDNILSRACEKFRIIPKGDDEVNRYKYHDCCGLHNTITTEINKRKQIKSVMSRLGLKVNKSPS